MLPFFDEGNVDTGEDVCTYVKYSKGFRDETEKHQVYDEKKFLKDRSCRG